METYRFFGVSEFGEIVSDRSFQCANDLEARGLAAAILEHNKGIEVWDVGRFVFEIARTPDGAGVSLSHIVH